MTCIVGIQKGNTVWLGGDSAGTGGDFSQRVIGDSKVFNKDECVIGICGSPKLLDAIRFKIQFPKQGRGGDDREFFSAELMPALVAGLKEAECIQDHPEHGPVFQGALLIGYRAKLYHIEANTQVITNAYGFDAVGAGSDIAIGSLHGSKNMEPRKRIIAALEASAINNATVRPPFNVVFAKKRFWQ